MFNRAYKTQTNRVNSRTFVVLIGLLLISTLLLTTTALKFNADSIYYESKAQLAAIDANEDTGAIPSRFTLPSTANLDDSRFNHAQVNTFAQTTAGALAKSELYDEEFTETVLSEIQSKISTPHLTSALRNKLSNLIHKGSQLQDEDAIAVEYDFMDESTPDTFDPDAVIYSAEGCVVKQTSLDEFVFYEDGTQSSVSLYSDDNGTYTLENPKVTTTPSPFHQNLVAASEDNGQPRQHEPGCSDFICDWIWQLESSTFPKTFDEVPWSDYWNNPYKYSDNYKLWVKKLSEDYYAAHPEHQLSPIHWQPGCFLMVIDFASPTGVSFRWETDLWICKQQKCSGFGSNPMGWSGNTYVDPKPDECTIDNQGYADPTGIHSAVQDSGIIIAFHFDDVFRQVRDVIQSVLKQLQGQRLMFSSGWAGKIFLTLDKLFMSEFSLKPKNGAMVFTLRIDIEVQLHINSFIEKSGVNLSLRDYRLTGSFVPTVKNGRFDISRVETHVQWDRLKVDTRGGLLQSAVIGLSGLLKVVRSSVKEILGDGLPHVLHQTLSSVSTSIALSPQNFNVPIGNSWSEPAYLDLSFTRPLLLDEKTSSLMVFLNGRTARVSDAQRFPQHWMKPVQRHMIGFTPRSNDLMDMLVDSFVFNDLLNAYFLTHKPSFTWSHLDQPDWLRDYQFVYDLLNPTKAGHEQFGTRTDISLVYAPQINFKHQMAEIEAKFLFNIVTLVEPFPQTVTQIEIDVKAILDFKLVNTYPRKLYPRLNDFIVDFALIIDSSDGTSQPVKHHLTLLNEFIHGMTTYLFKPIINTALSTGIELPELGELAYVAELGFEQDSMWMAVRMRQFA